VVVRLEPGADCLLLSIPKLHHLVPHLNPDWFTFLVPANLDCPGKRPLNV